MPTKFSHIKLGKKLLQEGHELERGSLWKIKCSGNQLDFLSHSNGVNLDLEKCSLEDLEKTIDVFRHFLRGITQHKTEEIEKFREIEHALKHTPENMRGLALFLGKIMGALKILVYDKRIVLNPLKELQKEYDQENMTSGLLQGMFFGLIKKLRFILKNEPSTEKQEKYQELINICIRIIKLLGSSSEQANIQIKTLS